MQSCDIKIQVKTSVNVYISYVTQFRGWKCLDAEDCGNSNHHFLHLLSLNAAQNSQYVKPWGGLSTTAATTAFEATVGAGSPQLDS